MAYNRASSETSRLPRWVFWATISPRGEAMLQMRLVIKGKVQKVGFRWSVLQHVKTSGLKVRGHVINLPDGSVELIAQGDIEALKDLHRFATKGPERAEVREVTQEINEISDTHFTDFTMG